MTTKRTPQYGTRSRMAKPNDDKSRLRRLVDELTSDQIPAATASRAAGYYADEPRRIRHETIPGCQGSCTVQRMYREKWDERGHDKTLHREVRSCEMSVFRAEPVGWKHWKVSSNTRPASLTGHVHTTGPSPTALREVPY
jgi:hypothetical protein